MIKRFLSLTLALCMLLSLLPIAQLGAMAYGESAISRNENTVIPSVGFKDVAKSAWYREAVDYAVSYGLMNGMGNNTFEPDTATNRAMLVTVLWRYAGRPIEGKNTFKDIKSGQWYTDAVTWAAKTEIVSGMDNNKFEPNGKLTREQLATILFRYSKQLGLDTSARADFGKFADGKKVQSWSKDAMKWAVAAGIIGGTSENGKLYLDPQGNATRAQVATILMRFIEEVLAPSFTTETGGHHHKGIGISVTYKGSPTNIGCMFYHNGRIFINRAELESAIGKTANGNDAYLEEIRGYISMADISIQYDISIACDAEKNVIRLYDAPKVDHCDTAGEGKAYIRLEDIMADGATNNGSYYSSASYSSYNLEKLRAIGEYMDSRGHKFYIAWIPVYVDPGRGVRNNVIENNCLYNADFIYTLDCLRIHGGKIVLHGYTHQQYDTVSSVGNEFGDDTEYSVREMSARMDNAIKIAKTLGYEYDTFEFPHYAVNDEARALAEEKFSVIYQYDRNYSTQIESVQRNGKTTYYIPAPVGHVYSAYDKTIFKRLQSVYKKGELLSLFFHPTIDFRFCKLHTEAGVRYCVYNEKEGFLPRILDKVESFGNGYGFTHFVQN